MNSGGGKFLSFLYGTAPGRLLLKPLVSRPVSKVCGALMNTRISALFVPAFVKRNGIDLSDYEPVNYGSFNDFFTRQVKAGHRPVDTDPAHLIAPCDGLLTVYGISDSTVFTVKQSRFTLAGLFGGVRDDLVRGFDGGLCLVFRLCVNHYHRYCYFDSGSKGENVFISGKLHTVRPVALEALPVFTENCREYTVIESDSFGKAVQMEVGALLVGKILNHDSSGAIVRGREKGMFLFGGSTVILILSKDTAEINSDIIETNRRGEEYRVKLGQTIGCAPGATSAD